MKKILRMVSLIGSVPWFIIGVTSENVTLILISIILMLSHNILYCLEDFFRRVIFFTFNMSFFVFLISKMIVVHFFGYKDEGLGIFGLAFDDISTVKTILVSQYLSLIGLFIGYMIIQKIDLSFLKQKKEYDVTYIRHFRFFSILFFYFCVIFRFYYLWEMKQNVQSQGYYEVFSTFTSSLPSVLVMFSQMFDVAFFAYLATNPTKKRSIFPIGIFMLEGLLGAMAGHRSSLMLNLVIVFIYFALRSIQDKPKMQKVIKSSKKKWLGAKEWFFVSLSLPAVLVYMTFIGMNRGNRFQETGGFFDSILNFFYTQGISANLIGYGQMFKEYLPMKGFYTLGPVGEFIDNKIIRPIQGSPELTGQTYERATEGFLFAHTISYFIMPALYLKGVGYGSSFIAEFFVDLSFLGVFLGSVMYGAILFILFYVLKNGNMLVVTFALIMTRAIMFAPRGAAMSFIVSAFTPSKIIAISIIFIGTFFMRSILGKNRRGLMNYNNL
ncbi:O-antigen polysaccharide polymerase Wzy family protein [Rossellomorea sp. DA94]|uniref:O-antigen polysaccharide polymerase Wzy family protein n=1 Tax=Rossellomorea sp. DA94 TaxID=3038653 RepID=UPI0024486DC7|nr:O-antigen polysaccharide polymerase Wzy family protein [Rossellomorea sp. DA94]WGG45413.1 O-antigen polysaccharide polymerase Wzy family protein [Rossellomorea sp. DA94]